MKWRPSAGYGQADLKSDCAKKTYSVDGAINSLHVRHSCRILHDGSQDMNKAFIMHLVGSSSKQLPSLPNNTYLSIIKRNNTINKAKMSCR